MDAKINGNFKTKQDEIVNLKVEYTPEKYENNKNESTRKEININSQLSDRKPKIFDLNSSKYDKTKTKNKYVAPGRNKDNPKLYQSQNIPFIYSQEQLKNFNKAALLNSTTFVPEIKKEITNAVDLKREHKKKKKNRDNSKIQPNGKSLAEQYEIERNKVKQFPHDSNKTKEKRKHSKRNASSNSGRSKLPYGLRKQLEELASMKCQTRYKSVDPPISSSNDFQNSERAKWETTNRIIVVDNFKNKVPTTSNEFKRLIDNDHRRHSSRFALRKYQDEMVNRLMSHKDKVDNK